MLRTLSRLSARSLARRPRKARKLAIETLESRLNPVTVSIAPALPATSSVVEGTPPGQGGTPYVVATLDAQSANTVTVLVSTGGGTATPGVDYSPLTNYLITFNP